MRIPADPAGLVPASPVSYGAPMAHDADQPVAEGRMGSWILLAILLGLLALIAAGGPGRGPARTAVSTLTDRVEELAGRMLGIRTHRCGTPNVGSNLRQIALSMVAYSAEADGVWPRDFKTVQEWSDGELVAKIFCDPRWPSDPEPFVYVRPSPAVTAAQPVLLTRPSRDRQPYVVICYSDGHIGKVAGRAQWDEARRLAMLPKATAEGIGPEDWTTVPELRTP